MEWICKGNPKRVGWYPVTIMYDVLEGCFPGASYWNGVKWEHDYVVSFIPVLQSSKVNAKTIAYANDRCL